MSAEVAISRFTTPFMIGLDHAPVYQFRQTFAYIQRKLGMEIGQ